jgi:carbon-monoxide dehydrogenase medium subunit
VQLLAREDARALAGGQSLVNVMKTRVASPELVVDLNGIDALRGITTTDGALEIYAMTTYAEIVGSAEVAAARPILAEVARTIADVQVRNRGTIGGNVCSNDPTNHFPPLLAALQAELTILGASGERTVGTEEFFEGVYMTAVQPGELLTKVRVPVKSDARDGWASVTLGKDGTGIVNVAATVSGGTARIAIGCVAATPVVVAASADETAVKDAVRAAALDPPADVHASADYRRHLAEVLAARAVRNGA